MKKLIAVALYLGCVVGARQLQGQCTYGSMQFPVLCSCGDGSTAYALPSNVAVPGKGRLASGTGEAYCGSSCYAFYPAAGACKAALSPSPDLIRLLDRLSEKQPIFIADCLGGLEQYAPSSVVYKKGGENFTGVPAKGDKLDRIYIPMYAE